MNDLFLRGVQKLRYIKSLFCLLAALACLLGTFEFISNMTVEANDEKIVRVGYYEEDGFQMGADDNKVKRGYSYDYLQRLKMLNSWKYEYVYGTYGELYEKLLKGEIDLLPAWPTPRTGKPL